jgi:hypothetical protein
MARLSAARTKGYANLSALLTSLFERNPVTATFVQTASLIKIPVTFFDLMNVLKLSNLEAIKVQYFSSTY